MANWQSAIVSYIDMAGVKRMLGRSSREAVHLLCQMHTRVERAAAQMSVHEEVCFWNDSVLLVGPVDRSQEQYQEVMREVRFMKAAVDKVKRSYAICVRGKQFPPPEGHSPRGRRSKPRVMYLRASSLAFSNCFLIEKMAKNNRWRRDWYLDDRIARKITARTPDWTEVVSLWPRNRQCELHMYKESFWHGEAPPH